MRVYARRSMLRHACSRPNVTRNRHQLCRTARQRDKKRDGENTEAEAETEADTEEETEDEIVGKLWEIV